MPSFGFRVFQLEVAPAGKKSTLPITDIEGHRLDDLITAALAGCTGRTRVSGDTTSPDTAATSQLRAMRVTSFREIGLGIFGRMRVGHTGEHDLALSVEDGDDDFDLSHHAPTREYRVLIAMPKAGVKALLAVETVGRTCPADYFASIVDEVFDQRFNAGDMADRMTLRVNPMTDEAELERLLSSANFETLQLTRHALSADGGRRPVAMRVVATNKQIVNNVDALRQLIRRWVSNPEKNARAARRVGASDLAAFIAPEFEAMAWDDASVTLSEDGKNLRRFTPASYSEKFTYSTGEVALQDKEFARMAIERMRSFQVALDVDLRSLSWKEVTP